MPMRLPSGSRSQAAHPIGSSRGVLVSGNESQHILVGPAQGPDVRAGNMAYTGWSDSID